MTPLDAAFFARNTLDVARDLIGCRLVRETESGRLVGRVVETEAYRQGDPAMHGWKATFDNAGMILPEGRAADLFAPPGTAYVYLIYGMYWLLNVVTEPEGEPGAVLIRAVEPVEGVDAMQQRRPNVRRERDLTNGPGKLTLALGIAEPAFHGIDLTRPPLYFAAREAEPGRIEATSRIGITRGVERHWRFIEAGNPFVSPGTPSDLAMKRRAAKRQR